MSTSTKFPPVKSKWPRIVRNIAVALMALLVTVLVARLLRETTPVQSFLTSYPGETHSPEEVPVGLPPWVGWQHFLNSLLIVLIIRSGWHVRTRTKPSAYWTRKKDRWPGKSKSKPTKISLDLWFHISLDTIWVLNGIVFFVLIFTTGHWKRLVPDSWGIFPNAISAALQYFSLSWPVDNGWVSYNSLQMLAYFTTVFIAAPLSIITGLRMSPAWHQAPLKLHRMFPIEIARAVHLWVMFYLVAFIVVHVALVLATGALRNLNHMYASQDTVSWAGLWIFAGSLAIMIAAWGLARPLFLRPLASITGSVTR
ncbi:cytochrome b/b6 domain-containing protein [Arthrobacter bambusae]